jgi:hypothetical protein
MHRPDAAISLHGDTVQRPRVQALETRLRIGRSVGRTLDRCVLAFYRLLLPHCFGYSAFTIRVVSGNGSSWLHLSPRESCAGHTAFLPHTLPHPHPLARASFQSGRTKVNHSRFPPQFTAWPGIVGSGRAEAVCCWNITNPSNPICAASLLSTGSTEPGFVTKLPRPDLSDPTIKNQRDARLNTTTSDADCDIGQSKFRLAVAIPPLRRVEGARREGGHYRRFPM